MKEFSGRETELQKLADQARVLKDEASSHFEENFLSNMFSIQFQIIYLGLKSKFYFSSTTLNNVFIR